MQCRLAALLCLVACLSHAHGYPRSSEEVDTTSQDAAVTGAGEAVEEAAPKASPPLASATEGLKTKYRKPLPPASSEEKDKDSLEKQIVKQATSGPKLKVNFPEDQKDAEDTDTVRSKKSPDMRDMTYSFPPGQHPHTTTVCIQVRSDHAPQVVCGPQVDDKKEEKPAPAARYAPEPYRGVQAQPQYQMPPPPPRRPYPRPQPYMRTEEEVRPAEPIYPPPAQSKGPYAVIPAQQSPGSVVVHKQYYAPAPPTYAALPPPTPLRLNCAYQPEVSYPYGYPYGSPLLRSSGGFVPVASEQVILQEGSRIGPHQYSAGVYPGMTGRMAAESSGEAGYYMDQEMTGSPYPYAEYADAWTGASWDDSQMQELQSRAAAGDESAKHQLWEMQQRNYAMGASPEETRRQYFQEQELRQSKQRLQRLENQLMSMQARATATGTTGEEQKGGIKVTMETGGKISTTDSDSQETKNRPEPKQSKRQIKVK